MLFPADAGETRAGPGQSGSKLFPPAAPSDATACPVGRPRKIASPAGVKIAFSAAIRSRPSLLRAAPARDPPAAAAQPALQHRRSDTGAGTASWPRLRATAGGASWQPACARKVRAKSPSGSPPPKPGVTPWHGPRPRWGPPGSTPAHGGCWCGRSGWEVSPGNTALQFQPRPPEVEEEEMAKEGDGEVLPGGTGR